MRSKKLLPSVASVGFADGLGAWRLPSSRPSPSMPPVSNDIAAILRRMQPRWRTNPDASDILVAYGALEDPFVGGRAVARQAHRAAVGFDVHSCADSSCQWRVVYMAQRMQPQALPSTKLLSTDAPAIGLVPAPTPVLLKVQLTTSMFSTPTIDSALR